MSCGKLFAPPPERLSADQTVPRIALITDWLLTPGLDFIKAVALLKAYVAGTGSLTVQLWYQTAAVRTDNPDAWTRLDVGNDPALSLVGGTNPDGCSGKVDISSLTSSKMLIRFAIGYFTSTAGAATSGDVSLVVGIAQCGQMSGGWSGQLVTSTTTPARMVVTGWLPALLAEKVKAGFLIGSAVGDFRCQLAYRKATSMQDVPGAWTALGSALSADGVLSDTTVSASGDMWVQFAIEYFLSQAGSQGSAYVSVSVGTRRA